MARNTKVVFALAMGLGLGIASLAYAEGCDYVEAAKNFEVGQHGALLASYMNYDPVAGTGRGNAAERDDDRFGVCRVLQDGTVITSFGCAGKDEIVHERMVNRGSLKTLLRLLDDKNNFKGEAAEPYRENLYDLDYEEGAVSLFARADRVNDLQKRVVSKSQLEKLVRQICPLDNEPAHRRLVTRRPRAMN